PLFRVQGTTPDGPVVVTPRTWIKLLPTAEPDPRLTGVMWEDVGGLDRAVERVREVVELPLRYPELFARLGVLPPKGVLLRGPPGTGKTLLERAVAGESRAHFIHVDGPEIMHKFYGESEARLRAIFEEAAKHAPTILFIDELDAVAPRRTETGGDVEKRVVAQ